MTAIAKRVAGGVAILDRDVPGWADAIDLNTLDIESTCDCVIGQLFRRPEDASGRYKPELGFDCEQRYPITDAELARRGREYKALTREWLRVIVERRTS